ncbi:MAG: 2-amino-4-hydroxy-6-hydroxymethyldihydropteridine diphosphokinase [Deltaproteobacteria bacterium]|nr:MAG: 2-amino-4-hydroxy-6-hydroxymethyldihydropteridine diphosphokinase [Deltaproteobacteria bacterium]
MTRALRVPGSRSAGVSDGAPRSPRPGWTEAYVALGSNLGDRARHLARAVRALREIPEVCGVEVSALYETDPIGPPPQGAYLNAVARLATRLAPHALLAHLLRIESRAGRVRGPERNLPRTLDLDLLLYGQRTLRTPELEVPHPRLHERGFVLEPLCDLAPELLHPTLGETIEVLARRVRDPAAVRRRSAGADADGSAASARR